MRLHYLLLAAACCAWLALGMSLTGCSDNAGGGQRLPDFSNLSILLFYDGELEGNFAQQALDDFGVNYTFVNGPGALQEQAGNAFDLVVVDNPGNDSETMLDVLHEYVETGGRMVISTWQSDTSPNHPIWLLLGANIGAAPDENVMPQFRWIEDHDIFTFPNQVPDLTEMTDDFNYGENYFPGNALPSAIAVGGITPIPSPDSATIFVHNSGRTVLNSFLLMDAVEIVDETVIPNDEDDDSAPDAMELWQNEIVYVLQGNVDPIVLPSGNPGFTRAASKSNKP